MRQPKIRFLRLRRILAVTVAALMLPVAALATAPAAHAGDFGTVCRTHAVNNGVSSCVTSTDYAATIREYRSWVLSKGYRLLDTIYQKPGFTGDYVTLLWLSTGCDEAAHITDIDTSTIHAGPGGYLYEWWDAISSVVNMNDYPNGAQCPVDWSRSYPYPTAGQEYWAEPNGPDWYYMPVGFDNDVKDITVFGAPQ